MKQRIFINPTKPTNVKLCPISSQVGYCFWRSEKNAISRRVMNTIKSVANEEQRDLKKEYPALRQRQRLRNGRCKLYNKLSRNQDPPIAAQLHIPGSWYFNLGVAPIITLLITSYIPIC